MRHGEFSAKPSVICSIKRSCEPWSKYSRNTSSCSIDLGSAKLRRMVSIASTLQKSLNASMLTHSATFVSEKILMTIGLTCLSTTWRLILSQSAKSAWERQFQTWQRSAWCDSARISPILWQDSCSFFSRLTLHLVSLKKQFKKTLVACTSKSISTCKIAKMV